MNSLLFLIILQYFLILIAIHMSMQSHIEIHVKRVCKNNSIEPFFLLFSLSTRVLRSSFITSGKIRPSNLSFLIARLLH